MKTPSTKLSSLKESLQCCGKLKFKKSYTRETSRSALLFRCFCLRFKEIYDFLLLLVPLRNLPVYKSPKSSAYTYTYIQAIQLKTQVLSFGGRADSPQTYFFLKKHPSTVVIKSMFVLLCYLYCTGRRPEYWQQAFLCVLYLR